MASILNQNEKAIAPETTDNKDSKPDVESGETPSWDQDVAMAVVGEHAHAFDPVVEGRVIRKIDLFMIPAMIVGYGFVYYDKVSPVPLSCTPNC